MIPNYIYQISKFKQPPHVIEMIKSNIPSDWQYKNYIDGDEVYYFLNNPLEEFPKIIDIFKSIKMGPHRADLFRYYILYINGGVYIDSDAMIYCNIQDIIKNHEFITVKSIVKDTIFNGFICAPPKHDIIYKALCHAYTVNNNDLDNDYLLLCRYLYNIIQDCKYNVKLYYEKQSDVYGCVDTMDEDKVILKHYQLSKVIPYVINKKPDTLDIKPIISKSKMFYYRK